MKEIETVKEVTRRPQFEQTQKRIKKANGLQELIVRFRGVKQKEE